MINTPANERAEARLRVANMAGAAAIATAVARIAASGGGGGGGGGGGRGGDRGWTADREHAADVHRTSCTYRPALVDDVVCPGNDVPPVPFREQTLCGNTRSRENRALLHAGVSPTRAVLVIG